MNKEFEKLPGIAESIKDGDIYFDVKEDCYIATDIEFYYDAGYANGAIYAYQEQQKIIDEMKAEKAEHIERMNKLFGV